MADSDTLTICLSSTDTPLTVPPKSGLPAVIRRNTNRLGQFPTQQLSTPSASGHGPIGSGPSSSGTGGPSRFTQTASGSSTGGPSSGTGRQNAHLDTDFLDGMSVFEFDERYETAHEPTPDKNHIFFGNAETTPVARAVRETTALHNELAAVYEALSQTIARSSAIATEKRRILGDRVSLVVRDTAGKEYTVRSRTDVYHQTKLRLADIFRSIAVLERPAETASVLQQSRALAEIEGSSDFFPSFARLLVSASLGLSRKKTFILVGPQVVLEAEASVATVDDRLAAALSSIVAETAVLSTDAKRLRATAAELYDRLGPVHRVLDDFQEATGITTIFTQGLCLQRRIVEAATESVPVQEVIAIVGRALPEDLLGSNPGAAELTSRAYVQRLRNRVSAGVSASLDRAEPKRRWVVSAYDTGSG